VSPSWRTAERAGVALLGLAALGLFLAAPTFPNYDAYYHLVWGRELFDGQLPTFEAYSAPTQHPLELVVTAVLGVLLGTGADRALVLIAVLSLVALAWAVFRLGARLLGPWPGVAAAFFTASSFSLLLLAARGYVDVPFLALVFCAAVLVVERGDHAPAGARRRRVAGVDRRDVAPMVLLLLAGLLRPEAWILAGLLGLWRRSVPLLAASAVAPLVWAGVDLAVTGDPLRSLTGTSELAEELGRERGVSEVPGSFLTFVADALRPPVALMAAAGLVLAWRRIGPRRLAVPLALLAAGIATFAGTGLAGLSILPRYLTVPTVALTLFAGYALAGFTTLRPGRTRRLWAYGAAVLLAGGVAFAAARAVVVDRLTAELAFTEASHRDLDAILRTRAVRDGLRCGPLTFPNYRLVPDARWLLDLPAERVGARSAQRRARGVAIFVVGEKALRRYGFADGASPSTNAPDPGFARAERRGRFVAYVSC
jgi:hypothetical protein